MKTDLKLAFAKALMAGLLPTISLSEPLVQPDRAMDALSEAAENENSPRQLAREGRHDEAEAAIVAQFKATKIRPDDAEILVALELAALAQSARNHGRFEEMSQLSRRALSRLERADKLTASDDLPRLTAMAEAKVEISKNYAPDAAFAAKAREDLALKRAALATRSKNKGEEASK